MSRVLVCFLLSLITILKLINAQNIFTVQGGLVNQGDPTCFRPPFVANSNPISGPDLPNGKYSVGFVLTYTCIPGFINVGSPTANCSNQNWLVIPSDPSCQVPRFQGSCASIRCPMNTQCTLQNFRPICTCIPPLVSVGRGCVLPTTQPTCGPNSCPQNSFCRVVGNAITCPCINGFVFINGRCQVAPTQATCDTPNICPGNSFCVQNGNLPRCVCNQGFEQRGGQCVARLSCTPTSNICPTNSRCLERGSEIICVCRAGFVQMGSVCTVRPTPAACTPVSCSRKPNSQCRLLRGLITCPCNTGFRDLGATCQPICTPTTCTLPNTQCVAQGIRPICQCVQGYQAVSGSCIEIPPIVLCDDPGACPANSRCIQNQRDVTCVCFRGFTGSNCQPICSPRVCPENSNCVPVRGRAQCRCNQGYQLNPSGVCQVVPTIPPDGCAQGCPRNSRCVRYTPQSTRVCVCRDGYVNDRGNCRPRSELFGDFNDCDDECTANSRCQRFQSEGTSVCACLPQFFLYYIDQPNTCQPRLTCNVAGVCPPNRRCVENDFGVSCECNPGFALRGDQCQLIPTPAVCTPQTCSSRPNTRCQVIRGQTQCICNDGFRPSSSLGCEPICASDTCTIPNSRCTVAGLQPRCVCIPGYRAVRNACLLIPVCTPATCINEPNTVCRIVGDETRCICNPGFRRTSSGCQAIPRCGTPGVCPANSRCIQNRLDVQCVCLSGFSGSNCAPICNPNSCPQPNTRCQVVGQGFQCPCVQGYRLDTNSNACILIPRCNTPNICPANSRCIQNPLDVRCVCNAGFTGSTCQPICNANSCPQPNTRCQAVGQGFQCPCVQGYRLDRNSNACILIPRCEAGNVCPANSRCIQMPLDVRCVCNAGFTGPTCQPICNANSCTQPNTRCQVVGQGFQCPCVQGYGLDRATNLCVLIRRCNEPGICPTNSRCVQQAVNVQCVCNAGFTGSTCQPICNPNSCPQPNTRCQVVGQGFQCTCVQGYRLDRNSNACVLIPVCTATTCSGVPNSFCRLVQGQTQCVCNPGFAQGPSGCVEIPTQPNCNPSCRGSNIRCVRYQVGVRNQDICICDPGYVNDGGLCRQRSLLADSTIQCTETCTPNSRCQMFQNSNVPVCACVPNYFLYYFDQPNTCQPRPVDATTSPPVRICQIPAINPSFNLVIVNQGTILVGDTVTFRCRGNFILRGSASVTCREGGLLVSSFPTCEAPVTTPRPDPTQPVCDPPCQGSNIRCVRYRVGIRNRNVCICDNGYVNDGGICRQRNLLSDANGCTEDCTPNSRCQIFRGAFVPVCACTPDYFLYYFDQPNTCQPRPIPAVIICDPSQLILPRNLVITNQGPIRIGGRIVFRCINNFLLQGSSSITCLPGGGFSSNVFPICVAPTTPAPVRCQRPLLLPGGLLTTVSDQASYAVGEIIQYLCTDTNFIVMGSRRARCLGTGQFMNAVPFCASLATTVSTTTPSPAADCIIPIQPQNGNFEPIRSVWLVGDTVTYSCNPGFRLVGARVATCLAGGSYTSFPPFCESVARCTPPYVPGGTRISPEITTDVVPGTRITYSCEPGREIIGGVTVITCQPDGSYSAPFPACSGARGATLTPVIQTCSVEQSLRPNLPDNAVIDSTTEYSVDQTGSFTCIGGFQSIGDTSIVCNSDGSFTVGTGFCVEINTVPVTISISSTPISTTTMSTTPMSTTTMSTTPMSTTTMSTTPMSTTAMSTTTTAETATPITCSRTNIQLALDINSALNSLSVSIDGDQEFYNAGESGSFSCATSQVLLTSNLFECNANGEIVVPDGPYCLELNLSCQRPNLSNIQVLPENQTEWGLGEVVTFSCPGSLVLMGVTNNYICGADGQFFGIIPQCGSRTVSVTVTCPRPSVSANVQILTSGDEFAVGNFLLYNCQAGFNLVGSESSTCQSNGSFDNPPPTCVEVLSPTVVCPSPQNLPFITIENPQNEYAVGEMITYSCLIGFQLTGDASASCTAAGTFSSPPPTCSAPVESATCNVNPPFGGIIVNEASTLRAGELAYFECRAPFRQLIGNSPILCLANGSLEFPIPRCTVCSPEPPANGRIDPENTEVYGVNDIITYECLPGFQLSEDSIPINFCQEDGTLVNPIPTCEPGSSSRIPDGCPAGPPLNGSILSVQTLTSTSVIISYGCFDGFEIEGSFNVLCMNGRVLPNELPRCVETLQ